MFFFKGISFLLGDRKICYNNMVFNEKMLKNQPGIESITKQYLYQLAYNDFLDDCGLTEVRNCFLMPTVGEKIINKGYVELGMIQLFDLNPIEVRLLPAEKYLTAICVVKKRYV